jgi:hypothetical protein
VHFSSEINAVCLIQRIRSAWLHPFSSSSLTSPESSCNQTAAPQSTALLDLDEGEAESTVAPSEIASAAPDFEQLDINGASTYSDQINVVLDHDDTDTWTLF